MHSDIAHQFFFSCSDIAHRFFISCSDIHHRFSSRTATWFHLVQRHRSLNFHHPALFVPSSPSLLTPSFPPSHLYQSLLRLSALLLHTRDVFLELLRGVRILREKSSGDDTERNEERVECRWRKGEKAGREGEREREKEGEREGGRPAPSQQSNKNDIDGQEQGKRGKKREVEGRIRERG